MNAKTPPRREHVVRKLAQSFESQRRAYLSDLIPNHAVRIQHLEALSRLVQDHQNAIVQAISEDFGNRSSTETLCCEIFLVLDGIKDTIKQLKRWMKPQRRHVKQMLYPGSKNGVIPRPLGQRQRS